MSTMTEAIFAKAFHPTSFPLPTPQRIHDGWRTRAHRRLTGVFRTANRVPFDDSSRFVFFSDCHRGDRSRADGFARNEEIFYAALNHYYTAGFTYVEVGDGDELLKNRRFSDVKAAHPRVFHLLHRFNQRGRLHLILGNHEIGNGRRDRVEKDGLVAREGLVLHHARTGQEIFVVHGHQADPKSDRFHRTGRFLVRHVWKRLQLLTVGCAPSKETPTRSREKIREKIVSWQQVHNKAVVCGHTHSPRWARYEEIPYFNTGSCLYPGYITGLELQNGAITLVRWSPSSRSSHRRTASAERAPLSPSQRLHRFI